MSRDRAQVSHLHAGAPSLAHALGRCWKSRTLKLRPGRLSGSTVLIEADSTVKVGGSPEWKSRCTGEKGATG